MPDELLIPTILVFSFVLIVVFAVLVALLRPWLRALMYSAPVPAVNIVAMRLRGNPPMLLIDAYISLRRAGIPTTIAAVEETYIDNKNRVSTSDDLVELVEQSASTG